MQTAQVKALHLHSVLKIVSINSFPQLSDTFPLVTMKLVRVAAFVFLFLVLTSPEETEAVPWLWFVRIAAKLGVKLLKNAYYARCNTTGVPSGINCPSAVFGMGWTRNQAQNAARAYASRFGDAECRRYVGHCQINKLLKGKGK